MMSDREGKKVDPGMNSQEIQEALLAGIEQCPGNTELHLQFAHIQMLGLHARALACHCECLGMNAENSMAVCGNYPPPYNDAAYYSVMQKWGLINEKGEPTI